MRLTRRFSSTPSWSGSATGKWLIGRFKQRSGSAWPAIAATCIIHLIRNTFRLIARQYWDEIKRDLKPIYTAINATRARAALDELAALKCLYLVTRSLDPGSAGHA
jgi:hypothetical protein